MLPQLVKRLKDNHLAEPKVGADFTGRVEEERTIVAALSREGGALTISALKGIGGVGKTALAVKTAHRLIACFRPRNCSSIGAARAKPPSPRVRRWRALSAASIPKQSVRTMMRP